MKSRLDRLIFGLFMALVLVGVIVGLLRHGNLIEGNLSNLAFGVTWIMAMNIWILGVMIQGDIRLGHGAGITLASRNENPIRFWLLLVVLAASFNGFGLLLLLSGATS